MRGAAGFYLRQLTRDSAFAVPALTTLLRDPNAAVRRFAVDALGEFAAEARSATPSLVNLLHDPDTYVRRASTNALRTIAPEALAHAPPN